MLIYLPSAVSELFDRVSILNIKQLKITDEVKLSNIIREHTIIAKELASLPTLTSIQSSELAESYRLLHATNLEIWGAIDELSRCMQADEDCTTAAKEIYLGNIARAKYKKKIDQLYGSEILEEKSYRHG